MFIVGKNIKFKQVLLNIMVGLIAYLVVTFFDPSKNNFVNLLVVVTLVAGFIAIDYLFNKHTIRGEDDAPFDWTNKE